MKFGLLKSNNFCILLLISFNRLSEFPHFRNNHKVARTSDIVKTKDLKSRSPHLNDCAKTDHRAKSDVSKDVHHNPSLPNLEKEVKSHSEKKSSSHLPASAEKHCTNGIWSRSHYQVGEWVRRVVKILSGWWEGSISLVTLYARNSQPWCYWHIGSDNYLWWGASQCVLDILEASLASTHW